MAEALEEAIQSDYLGYFAWLEEILEDFKDKCRSRLQVKGVPQKREKTSSLTKRKSIRNTLAMNTRIVKRGCGS